MLNSTKIKKELKKGNFQYTFEDDKDTGVQEFVIKSKYSDKTFYLSRYILLQDSWMFFIGLPSIENLENSEVFDELTVFVDDINYDDTFNWISLFLNGDSVGQFGGKPLLYETT